MCTRFLVCGFPRSEENWNSWKKLVGSSINVSALVSITYTRKEFEYEIRLREGQDGKKYHYKDVIKRFNDFLNNTYPVFKSFDEKKMIKISAKLEDDQICNHLNNSPIIIKRFPKLD